jgi:hypothetical protein
MHRIGCFFGRKLNHGSQIVNFHTVNLINCLVGAPECHAYLKDFTPPRSHQGDLKGFSSDLPCLGRLTILTYGIHFVL